MKNDIIAAVSILSVLGVGILLYDSYKTKNQQPSPNVNTGGNIVNTPPTDNTGTNIPPTNEWDAIIGFFDIFKR